MWRCVAVPSGATTRTVPGGAPCDCANWSALAGTSTTSDRLSETSVTLAVIPGSSGTGGGSTLQVTVYVTTFDDCVPIGGIVSTLPVKVLPGKALTVKLMGLP